MNRRWGLAALGAATVLAWSVPSAAQDAHGFGDKGQLIISADRLFPLFSYSSVSTTDTANNVTTTTTDKGSSLVLLVGQEPEVAEIHTVPRVAFDFTVIPRLTVGGAVVVGFGLGGSHNVTTAPNNGPTTTSSNDAPSQTILGIAPRVGYILPLADVLAFWPRAGFAFYSIRSTSTTTNNNNTVTNALTDTAFSLDLDPQLAIVPLEHFFFLVGPLINIPLAGSQKIEKTQGGTSTTTSDDLSIFHIGIEAGLGGWFNL